MRGDPRAVPFGHSPQVMLRGSFGSEYSGNGNRDSNPRRWPKSSGAGRLTVCWGLWGIPDNRGTDDGKRSVALVRNIRNRMEKYPLWPVAPVAPLTPSYAAWHMGQPAFGVMAGSPATRSGERCRGGRLCVWVAHPGGSRRHSPWSDHGDRAISAEIWTLTGMSDGQTCVASAKSRRVATCFRM